MLRSSCDEAHGYTWHGQGQYSGENIPANECGTCDIDACPTNTYTVDTDCPNNASTGAPTLRATGLSATVEGYSDGKECRKCTYDCDTGAGYYKSTSACVSANGGQPCTKTTVNNIDCYVPGSCPAGTTYYASSADCEAGGYTCEEDTPGSNCYTRTIKSCTDYSEDYMLQEVCTGEGFQWTAVAGAMSGGQQCCTCGCASGFSP